MLKVLPASHFSQDFPIFYTKTYKERQLSLPSIHSLTRVALPNIYFSHTTDLIRQLSHTHMLLPFLNLGTYTTSYHFISRSRVAQCKELPLLDREVACSNPGCNEFFSLCYDQFKYPADIWRQCDVGMTSDSDVGLTLQEGCNWKFSRRRIWSRPIRPKSNLIPTSLQRRVPAGLSFIKVRESMKCVFPGLEVCEMSSYRQHAKISGNIKSIESIFMK